MIYLLLVTWIYPDHPPASYQVEFASEQACIAAQKAVYAQAAELRQNAIKLEGIKIKSAGLSDRTEQLAIASLRFADASAVCVKH